METINTLPSTFGIMIDFKTQGEKLIPHYEIEPLFKKWGGPSNVVISLNRQSLANKAVALTEDHPFLQEKNWKVKNRGGIHILNYTFAQVVEIPENPPSKFHGKVSPDLISAYEIFYNLYMSFVNSYYSTVAVSQYIRERLLALGIETYAFGKSVFVPLSRRKEAEELMRDFERFFHFSVIEITSTENNMFEVREFVVQHLKQMLEKVDSLRKEGWLLKYMEEVSTEIDRMKKDFKFALEVVETYEKKIKDTVAKKITSEAVSTS